MNVSRAVARVYAQAMLDLGVASGTLPRIVDDLQAVAALYEKDAKFRAFFTSPRVEPARKKTALDAALGGKLGREVQGLLHVLVDKRREVVLDNIVDEFERFRDLREGRIHVHVTTARALEAPERQEVGRRLARATGKSPELHEKVDARLLGGLIVKVGDRVLDGSLRRRLDRLRRTMTAAHEGGR
ncbi:MAG: ATP synthase F1 subunit delta [Planctomycetaceae bacterium]